MDKFDQVYREIISEGFLDSVKAGIGAFKKNRQDQKNAKIEKDSEGSSVQIIKFEGGSTEGQPQEKYYEYVNDAVDTILPELIETLKNKEFGYGYWNDSRPMKRNVGKVCWKIEARVNEQGNKEIVLAHCWDKEEREDVKYVIQLTENSQKLWDKAEADDKAAAEKAAKEKEKIAKANEYRKAHGIPELDDDGNEKSDSDQE